MKKTVSVNIKGLNFLIEEDAYELLQDYLDRLAIQLQNDEGKLEIIEDVELRIAELCNVRLNDSKTVIEFVDIQDVIATLGNPEDYTDNEEMEDSNSYQDREKKSTEKRLFRDTDNATIAGVCSGIANFFGIDVVIIRAIFVVMFFFVGFGFPLYVILWIIVPKAKSSIDRLRMKGRPITVENVRDEVEIAAENLSKGSRKFASSIQNNDTYKTSISRGASLISTIFGIGFICLGIFFLIPFLIFIVGGFEVFPIQSDTGFVSFPEFGDLILQNNSDYSLLWIGVLLTGFSIILFLLILGVNLLFRLKSKLVKFSLLGLFFSSIAGIIICAIIGIRTGKDFVIGAEIEKEIAQINAPVLEIIPELEKVNYGNDFNVKSHGNFGMMEVKDNKITLYGVRLSYQQSNDSLFHIKQNISARAINHEKGIDRCKNVKHKLTIEGNKLKLKSGYSFPSKDKLRDQEITIIIEVPKNGIVKMNQKDIKLGIENEDIDTETFNEKGYLKGDGTYNHWD